jgi:hypothetical protein
MLRQSLTYYKQTWVARARGGAAGSIWRISTSRRIRLARADVGHPAGRCEEYLWRSAARGFAGNDRRAAWSTVRTRIEAMTAISRLIADKFGEE